jgi:hypothetical protein
LTRSLLQRIFGAGRLTVSFADAAPPDGRAVLVLDHVPLVFEVQRVLVTLVGAAPRIASLPPEPPVAAPDPALPDLS